MHLFIDLPTSHCSPAECLLRTSLSTLCAQLHYIFYISCLCLSLLLSYYHLTSIQWTVECINGSELARQLLTHSRSAEVSSRSSRVALLRGHTRPTSEMDVLSGVHNHVWLHTHLHIWTDYFQSGRTPPSVPEGVAVTAWPDGPPERAHCLTVLWRLLTDVSFALITDFGKNIHIHINRTGHCFVNIGIIYYIFYWKKTVFYVVLLHSQPNIWLYRLSHEHMVSFSQVLC